MEPKINILTGNLLGEGGTQSGKISPRECEELSFPEGTGPFTPTHRGPLLSPHLPAKEDRKQEKERPRLSCSIISSHTYCLRATCVSRVFTVFFLKCPDTQTPHSNHITENRSLTSLLRSAQLWECCRSLSKTLLIGGGGSVTHLGVFHRGSHSTRMALQGAPGSHRP